MEPWPKPFDELGQITFNELYLRIDAGLPKICPIIDLEISYHIAIYYILSNDGSIFSIKPVLFLSFNISFSVVLTQVTTFSFSLLAHDIIHLC